MRKPSLHLHGKCSKQITIPQPWRTGAMMFGMIRALIFALCGIAVTGALAEQPWKPADVLRAQRLEVREAYRQPWHRIVSFQLYDQQGHSIQAGTVEDFY